MLSSIIRKFVAKQMAKSKGVIANTKAVDFSSAAMEDRLMRNGFDPNAIKSESELLAVLNSIKQKENLAFQREFKDIFTRKDANVFDLQGNKIDTSKPIMGGKNIPETEEEILARIQKENKESVERLKEKKDIKDPEDMASGGRAGFKSGLGIKFLKFLNENNPVQAYKKYLKSVKDRTLAGKEAEVAGEVIPIAAGGALITNQLKKKLKSMNEEQKKKIKEEAQAELREDKAYGGRIGLKDGFPSREENLRLLKEELKEIFKKQRDPFPKPGSNQFKDFKLGLESILSKSRPKNADGGRIGLKTGMSRRAFLKLIGGVGAGLGALKSGILKLAGKEAAPQVAKEVVQQTTKSTPPPYFFELANKIKSLGKPDKVTYADRVEIHRYTGKNGDEYELIEDLSTGDMKITKDKTSSVTAGDETYEGISDRSVMEYKKGDVDIDPDKKISSKAPDEYDEYKVEFDVDGTEADADDMSEFIRKEIIEEANQQAPKIKKAGGGVAYMLGE